MSKKHSLSSLLVLAGGIILTLIAWQVVVESEQRQARADFVEKAKPLSIAIERSIASNVEVIRSIGNLYRGSEHVSRREFAAFTEAALELHPGVTALEWVPRISRQQLPIYIDAAQADGLTGFQLKELADGVIRPAGDRDVYFPVYYAEPQAENTAALGVDLGSEPERRRALEAAAAAGSAVATGKIRLVQGGADAFLLFVPVYKKHLNMANAEAWERNLLGFALGVYRFDNLLTVALQGDNQLLDEMSLALFDLSAADAGASLLFSTPTAEHTPSLSDSNISSLTYQFEVGGRQWLVRIDPKNPHFGVYSELAPWLVIATGGLLTFLLFFYLLGLSDHTATVEEIVEEQAEQLRHTEAFNAAVLETVVDGIITIDPGGIIQTCNPATERMFGFSREELIGQNIKILMPGKYAEAHDGYLHRYMETGEAHVVGIGREVEGQRKNGETFPLELAVSRMEIDGDIFFTGVVRDITERKQVEKLKAEFISTVSHELRTPLTSIRGAMGLVAGGAAGELPEKAKKLVAIAASNSERLVRLINDILDIEKIESGKMMFDLSARSLAPIIEQAIEENRSYAEQHGAAFHFDNQGEGLQAKVDADRLRQVLDNLLSNAAKYGGEQDKIDVSLVRTDNRVRVRITDHGPGIPEAFQARIFSKFAQADSSDTRGKGGTGLGLSIARAIIEHHGGQLWFETELGKGTSFIFELPLLGLEEPRSESFAHKRGDSRVLICEDDADIGTLLRMMLEKEGVQADIAVSAEDAARMLAEHRYQLMTLDLTLPGRDGYSLLNDLRASEQFKNLPVVVSGADRSNTLGVLQISDWISKPIHEKRLVEAVQRGMRSRPDGGPAQVLHVEDDPDVADVIEEVLKEYASIDRAVELSVARRKLDEHDYDLVILDVGLPDGSGLDLLPQLSAHQPQIPVLIFSAQDVTSDVVNNVAGVLVKSRTDNTELIGLVKELLHAESDGSRSEQA